MTEKNLIDFLSNESERMDDLFLDNKVIFDTEICGWKSNPISPQSSSKSLQGPASFRIRTIETKPHLRKSSLKGSLKSLSSSGGSRNTSPGENSKGSTLSLAKEAKKRLPSVFYQASDDAISAAVPTIDLRIRPPRPKKRKPIKAFKIPKENEE